MSSVCRPARRQLDDIACRVGLPAPKEREKAIFVWHERTEPRVVVGQIVDAAGCFRLSIGRIEPRESDLPLVRLISRVLTLREKQIAVIDKLKTEEIADLM